MSSSIRRGIAASILLAAACPIAASLAGAADAESGATDRVDQLERENAEIRAELERQRGLLDRLLSGAGEAAADTGDDARAPAPVDAEDGLFEVKSKLPIVLSGFLKGDLLWNAPRLNSTSAPRFVLSEPGHRHDDQLTATIQHSRIQARIGEVDLGGGTAALGHVELDLFNLSDTGDTNFNNNQLRVRQLYASVSREGWSLLFGQAWDVFSPLNPSSFNTNGNYWFGGNAGFRRPQVRASKKTELGPGSFDLAASVNSNIGITVTDGGRTLDSGRDSGIPVLEGGADYSFPALAGTARVGVSGLWGEEDIDGFKQGIAQWALGAHASLPLTGWATLMGEYQAGENTDSFLTGGGINTTTGDRIGSHSGWAQLALQPAKRVTVNLLFGVNDLDRGEVAPGGMVFNQVAGANVKLQVFEPLAIGLEYTHFDTDYRAAQDETAHLVWTSAILSF